MSLRLEEQEVVKRNVLTFVRQLGASRLAQSQHALLQQIETKLLDVVSPLSLLSIVCPWSRLESFL
jgi:Ser/Thr protein kinase RdoA (MazF antagonist)